MATQRTFGFVGGPAVLEGPQLKVGDKAPNFEVQANDLSKVTLLDSQGKVRVLSVVPSLDTSVCDTQTRRFNQEASDIGEHIVILTISADLPFAQKRWCGAAGVERVQTLSDHLQMSFGKAYGTSLPDFRLESRAVFVVDSSDTVVYVEYVPDAGQQPNYADAIAAAKTAK
ncbi:thiol peroxidase [Alicyclobacillaceae bacterium I2511]|nr:thiol peroxidase [Alicyclobacillaceae bacterium I2511]